jgi:hypothetical protein
MEVFCNPVTCCAFNFQRLARYPLTADTLPFTLRLYFARSNLLQVNLNTGVTYFYSGVSCPHTVYNHLTTAPEMLKTYSTIHAGQQWGATLFPGYSNQRIDKILKPQTPFDSELLF